MSAKKLNIGDYVRTNDGLIDKIKYTDNDNNIFLENYNKENNIFGANSIIIKSSPNIIDLIEVGDYVNGRKVYQIGYNAYDDFALKMSESNYEDFIYQQDIKSIVTKEQFESMEYKIGE